MPVKSSRMLRWSFDESFDNCIKGLHDLVYGQFSESAERYRVELTNYDWWLLKWVLCIGVRDSFSALTVAMC